MVPHVKSSTNYRIGCWTDEKIFTIVVRQPSPQLFDDCTCGTIPFHLYRDFPVMAYLVDTYELQSHWRLFKVLLGIQTASGNVTLENHIMVIKIITVFCVVC